MRLFTYQQGLADGLTRHQIYGPAFQQVLRGVHAPSGHPPTLHDLVDAARLVLPPDAMVTGRTALQLSGIGLGQRMPLQFAARFRTRRAEIALCAPRDGLAGRAVAPLSVAVADCDLGLLDRVAALDVLLARELVTMADLEALPELRDAIALSDPRSQSFRESRIRAMAMLAGLPTPVSQYDVHDQRGRIACVDLAWPEFKVCAEYEGLQHATDPVQWQRDIDRYRRLEEAGWVVIRITSTHLRDPSALMLVLSESLRRRGWLGRGPRLGGNWLARVA